MSNMIDIILEQTPEVQKKMRDLLMRAQDQNLSLEERVAAATELGDLSAPLIIESARRDLGPPRYEYRFVRGAKVKVRVN